MNNTNTFESGWNQAGYEIDESLRQHVESLKSGYRKQIKRHEELEMNDRLEDAKVVLRKLTSTS